MVGCIPAISSNHIGWLTTYLQSSGHAETYFEPTSGIPINYGVQAYINDNTTQAFFGRLGVALQPATVPPFKDTYIDFTTGKPVLGYPSADPAPALAKYVGLISQAPLNVLQTPGGALDAFNAAITPESIDPFIQPFGEFVTKNGLEAALPVFWAFDYAFGDLAKAPVLNAVREFGLEQLLALSTNGFVIPASYANSELYSRALGLLGKDVLLNSTVDEITRYKKKAHEIVINTPTGKKLVKAKKLVITIAPSIHNLDPLDISKAEKSVFKQWNYQTLYVGVVSNTGLPDNVNFINTSPTNTFNFPTGPFVYRFDYSGVPGHFRFVVVGDSDYSAKSAKKLIKESIKHLALNGTASAKPVFNVFTAHKPNTLRPSAQAIKDGFYKKLYSLQGYKNTFWLGAGWSTDYSSLLWNRADQLLPTISA